MRKPIIAGNWKMNNTAAEGVKLVEALKGLVKDANCDVVACVPFTDIPAVSEAVKGTNIHLGAQNVHFAEKALSRARSPLPCSKSTAWNTSSSDTANAVSISAKRTKRSTRECTRRSRRGSCPSCAWAKASKSAKRAKTEQVLKVQVEEGLKGLDDVSKIVIAYEPIWAIGTGKTATAEQANETIGFIRKTCGEVFCPKCAEKVRIQYGGSMNAKNCKELMAMPEIDGGLIGGASLKAEDFSIIVNFDK